MRGNDLFENILSFWRHFWANLEGHIVEKQGFGPLFPLGYAMGIFNEGIAFTMYRIMLYHNTVANIETIKTVKGACMPDRCAHQFEEKVLNYETHKNW